MNNRNHSEISENEIAIQKNELVISLNYLEVSFIEHFDINNTITDII